jgi:hypothetical protein
MSRVPPESTAAPLALPAAPSAAGAARLAIPAALLLLLAGLWCIGLYARHDLFDPDEFQHAHIAWLVAGGQVPYRDFWEHHGPLYGLVNGALLALAGPRADLGVLFACRIGSMLAGLSILACTWGIARRVALPTAAALTAVAITASLVFVQDKIAECRPDGWQNLFWLGGVWLLLEPRRRVAATIGAGALFGLAVLTNAKAALGPAVVVAWYLLGARLHGRGARAVAGELAGLLAGGIAVCLPVVGWFAAQGAAGALLDYGVVWNLHAIMEARQIWTANLRFLLLEQAVFVALFVAGVVAWWRDLARSDGVLPRPGASLVLAIALGTGLSLGLNFYTQFFLMFLPLWSIIAAFGVFAGGRWLAAVAGRAGRVATGVLVVAGAAVALSTALRIAPAQERPVLAFQQAFTRMMVAATARTEPVGVIWDICGGFMFNQPLQFYWAAEALVGATAARHSGRDPFAEDFVAALEARKVRFVIGRNDAALPEATQRYLREHYRYDNCLWRRRREPPGG